MPGYATTFIYQDKEYPLSLTAHWGFSAPLGLRSKYSYQLLINHYYQGCIFRDEHGFWLPLDRVIFSPNDVFVLQAHDYQVLGEIIEREFPEWV